MYCCLNFDNIDANHRLFLLRSVTDDAAGKYQDMGRVRGMSEHWAIDPNIISFNDKLYLLWSGWPEPPARGQRMGGPQTIYIQEMSDPLTVTGKRVAISRPSYSWETHGWPVNEGPEAFQHGDRMFVLFSASGGSTENYCLGLLSLKSGANPMDASAWNKTDHPVFAEYTGPDGAVFGPGHCAVFTSPDSHESWLLYHARDEAGTSWMGRSARAQSFNYSADGIPSFGHPLPRNSASGAAGGGSGGQPCRGSNEIEAWRVQRCLFNFASNPLSLMDYVRPRPRQACADFCLRQNRSEGIRDGAAKGIRRRADLHRRDREIPARDAELTVIDVSDVTGFPEMMDGRVKTLHPKIHGGLLSVRDNPEHVASMKAHDIAGIDLVCINLYPFEQTIAKPSVTFEEAIENIDIGGPSMVRSAAKNHRWVLVVTSPDRYEKVLGDLREHKGSSCGKHRLKMAQRAFAATSRYDGLISEYLEGKSAKGG